MPSIRRSILLSPATRTSLAAGQAASESLNASLSENNDAAEKRERTRSRLVEIQLSASPKTSESRNSFGPIASLNAVQLAEHYTSCMKLSNENKINAKNAFQLQLIDYMAMMLKKKESELDNFQVASCTLDASTKIYAYRVDSIHNDAVKMAGGLLRSDNKKRADDDGSEGEGDKENAEGQPVKKKRATRRCATVESNLKNLNSKEVDKECRIDPFFKRMATRFDEGQSGGCHFLANLRVLDDSQEIILSSDIIWWRNRQTVDDKPNEMISIPIPNFESIRSAEICPTFSTFTFNGWSPENDDSIVCSDIAGRFGQDQILGRDAEHAFDMNAIPEPVEASDDDMPDICDGMEVDNDVDENTVGTVEVMGCNQKKGKSSWEFTDLRNFLSTDPQEYSYFQKGAMIGWAGPSHWKIKPLVKQDQPKVPGKKKPRKVLTLAYETDASLEATLEAAFEPADKPTCLTDATVEKWSDLKTTLPEDLHLGVSSLIRLFLKPNMAIHTKKSGAVEVEGVGQYNFDNENDKENYCTNFENDDNVSDDERDASAVFPMEGNEKDELSQAESGYDLVQAPNMVANVYIPYAKRAKKMDMKRLQKTIFRVLTHKDSKIEAAPSTQEDEPEQLKDTFAFSEVFEILPKKLPQKEALNLSFPLAFVALLHLANDKTLKLEDKSDLSDLVISQDEKLC